MLDNIQKWLTEMQNNIGSVATVALGIVGVVCAFLAIIQAFNNFRKNDYKKGALFAFAAILIGAVLAIGVLNALEIGKSIAPDLQLK